MLSAMSDVAIVGHEACTANSSGSPMVPERSRSELLIALAVFLAACLYLWPLRDFVSFNADEGIILSDADRILRGQVPYRDFFYLYTPGSYFLLALAFKLFGQSLVVARSILLVYCGVFSSLSYRLARRISLARHLSLRPPCSRLVVFRLVFLCFTTGQHVVCATYALFCQPVHGDRITILGGGDRDDSGTDVPHRTG